MDTTTVLGMAAAVAVGLLVNAVPTIDGRLYCHLLGILEYLMAAYPRVE